MASYCSALHLLTVILSHLVFRHSAPIHGSPPVCKLTHSIVRFFIALFPILPTVYFVDMCPNLTSSLSFRFFLQCILSICAQISLHRSLSDSPYSVFCRYVPKSHFIALFPILPTVYFVDMCPNLTSSLSFRFSLQCILSICAQISLHRSLSDSPYSVFCRYVLKSHFIALFPILPTVYFVDMCPNLTSSLSFRFSLQCILSICAQISLHRSLSDSSYSVFCRYVPKSRLSSPRSLFFLSHFLQHLEELMILIKLRSLFIFLTF